MTSAVLEEGKRLNDRISYLKRQFNLLTLLYAKLKDNKGDPPEFTYSGLCLVLSHEAGAHIISLELKNIDNELSSTITDFTNL